VFCKPLNRNMAAPEYPPPPWNLNATAYLSFWRVPHRNLGIVLPADLQPLSILGSVFLCSGFVSYESGGDLQYREFFVGLLVRAQGRFAVNLPWIWVDSRASLVAGRELWAIPKQYAQFCFCDSALSVQGADQPTLATMSHKRLARLPWRLRVRAAVAQPGRCELLRTRMAVSAGIEWIRAKWYIAPESSLAFLRGRSPLLSIRLTSAKIRFGA
jgi:hypothetical protein